MATSVLDRSARVGPELSARWALLESRIRRPLSRKSDVPRRSLVAHVRSSEGRLISVVAPAGYGKTSLMVQVIEDDPRPCAWLSIGHDCNDPPVLARYLLLALAPLAPLGDDLVRELHRPRPRMSLVARELGAGVAAAPSPLIVVVDDLHQLTNDAGVGLLETVLGELPEGSQAALVGRPGSSFPLGRVRAMDGLVEIGSEELRLDVDEAGQLLRLAGIDGFSSDEVRELTDRAEGWAAGIYLAARYSASGSPDDVILAMRGDDRFIGDYLRETVLLRIPEDELRFMVQTSFLDVMTGPLCDATLATTGSGARLEALEASNRLVIPLDHHREAYRYHHLLQEFLRTELEHRTPELVPVLAGRASAWSEEHQDPIRAVEHAMAGSLVERVAELIARYGQSVYYDGGARSLRNWLQWIESHAALELHPYVAVLGGWVMMWDGSLRKASRWAAAAASHHEEMSDPENASRVLLEAAMCREGADRMREDAERALTLLPAHSAWVPTALILLGLTELVRGDVDAADGSFTQAAHVGSELGTAVGVSIALAELARIALYRRDVSAAASRVKAACRILGERHLEGYATSVLTVTAAARVALAQGDPDRARLLVAEAGAGRSALTIAMPTLALQARVDLAQCALGLGELDLAAGLVAEADDIARSRPDLGVLLEDLEHVREAVGERVAESRPTLTRAEARLLPFLATNLIFREIGEELFISQHTVKTQAISIYRKLGVSSRSEAVQTARDLGLLAP